MRLNAIPRLDPYQFTRNALRSLKISGSQAGQTYSLVEKSNQISLASKGEINVADHSITVTPNIARKLNII